MAGKPADGARRHFSCTLDPTLAQAVHNYMTEQGMDNLSEAVRSLCRIALASTPEDGAIEAARIRAWNEVRNFSMSRLAIAHAEIAAVLREQHGLATLGSSNSPYDGNRT